MNRFLRGLAAIGLFATALGAAAQAYPSKPITIVVPFPPGGGSDLMARKLGEPLGKLLGQTVIVDNKAGAAGNIGAQAVARAAPDGYTLMITAAPFAIAPAMYDKLGFDPVADFTPITQIATVPLLIVTRPESPLNSIADLLAQARRDGPAVNFASFGNGSPPHLVGESINLLGKVKMSHIPYKGGQAALPDILSGQLTVAILDAVSMAPLVKAGRLKALAITGTKRSPVLPQVPTLAEAGIDFRTVGWHAVFAPAKLPPELARKLNQAFNQVLADPEMRRFIVDGGSIPIEPATYLAAWAAQFQDDVRVWGKAARASGARVE